MTPTTAVDATGLVKSFGEFRMLATLLPIDDGRASLFGVDVAREPHGVRQLLGVTGQYVADACAAGDAEAGARSMENLRYLGDAFLTDVAEFRRTLAPQG